MMNDIVNIFKNPQIVDIENEEYEDACLFNGETISKSFSPVIRPIISRILAREEQHVMRPAG